MTENNAPPQLGEIHSKSRREQVLDALREAILAGDFKPGQALVETELATQLGVSRAPLREAIQILCAEGLVETVPYRGTTVRGLTRTDIEELYSLRAVLESFAIQRILTGKPQEAAVLLKEIYQQMLNASTANDLKALNKADQHFHMTLITMSRHGLLLSVWNTVAMRVRQVMALRNEQNLDLAQVAHNHLPIIEAIAGGDLERALTTIQQHAASAGDLMLDQWEWESAEEAEQK